MGSAIPLPDIIVAPWPRLVSVRESFTAPSPTFVFAGIRTLLSNSTRKGFAMTMRIVFSGRLECIRRLYGRMRTRTERPPHSVKIADESTRATMRIENNDNPIRKIRGVRGVPQKLPREGQCTVHSSRRFPIQHSRFPGSNCAEPMRESPLDCAGFFTFCQYDNCRGGSSQARTDRMDWERGIRLRSRRGRHQAAAGNEFADFDGGRWTIGPRLHSYL